MNRPLHGSQNPTPVDHATDTYDTIDWLVKNVPETNGKVGILGISYDGFLPLMALVNPHPALKVSVPMNPMVDGWRGDDWFHNGAFRQQMMGYIYDQQATRKSEVKWWTSHFDDYDEFIQAGSAGALGAAPRPRTDRLLAKDSCASQLRRLLARPGRRPDPGGSTAESARHAGAQSLGPGRHLRRDRRLQSHQTERHK
jgi:predicted acyl esterase